MGAFATCGGYDERMFSAMQQALESLSAALDAVETAPTGELRRALGLAKSLRTKAELLETRAASLVAQRERHGDGGAGLLSQVGGRSRSEAARNVRVTAELAALPDAQSAVAEGEISFANAAMLAQAARRTSPGAVQDDAGLVEMAKALPADEFAQAAQRWTIQHQSVCDLEAQHRRNRRNRSVRFWNGEDGTVQMRGAFDAEMGARIQSRLRATAEQLRRTDRRKARDSTFAAESTADPGDSGTAANGTTPPDTRIEAVVRTRDQRMADALDRLLAGAPSAADASRGASAASVSQSSEASASPNRTPSSDDLVELEQRRTVTEIIVRADLDAVLGKPGGVAEIAGAGPIPPSALDRLLCDADLSLIVCGADFAPLYEAVASRAPTAAQRRALIARDGACIGCGELPGECEAHHIIPWKCGGKTRIDNLVLVCWSCHDRIHDCNWRVVVRDGRFRLVPPDPAHPHNPARSRKPSRGPSTKGSMQPGLEASHADGYQTAGCAARVGDVGSDGFSTGDDRPPPEAEIHDLFTSA